MNPFENIQNYMNAVWEENLSDSYTNESYGYSKWDIFINISFFEEYRIEQISPYKAMLAFVEFENNKQTIICKKNQKRN